MREFAVENFSLQAYKKLSVAKHLSFSLCVLLIIVVSRETYDFLHNSAARNKAANLEAAIPRHQRELTQHYTEPAGKQANFSIK
jgi:hypothetical protein